MITVTANRITTNVHKFKYPDTCVGIDIQAGSQPIDYLTGIVQIGCVFGHQGINGEHFSINDDLIALANVVDAVECRYPNAGIELYLPYLPYSRQDRAVKPGEANSLKVIGKMINGMGFRSVFTYDAHSTVADCAIDNLRAIAFLHDVVEDTDTTYEELYEAGFNENVVQAVGRITKHLSLSYEQYIDNVLENDLATIVKLCDTSANLMNSIHEGNTYRINKYSKQIQLLGGFDV